MPLPFPYHLEDGETKSVKVFHDHPEWDQREKWWMMPSPLLQELYICTYDVADEWQLDWVEKQHPGCILIY